MKLIRKIWALGLLGLALGGAINSAEAKEYIVKYKDSLKAMPMRIASHRVMDTHDVGQLVKINLNQKNEALELLKVMSDPSVEYVVENVKVRAFTEPVDPNALKEQWAMKKINAEKAWAIGGTKGSKQVLLAVIDTGTDYNHNSLKTNMIAGYDFRDNDADPMDLTSAQNPGHGTHCSGIITANGLVDGGIIGISPELSMMPIRFLGADGSGDLMGGIKSIDYAIEKGVHVISASWGAAINAEGAKPLSEAVQRASDKGLLFVSAASNDGKNNDSFDVYPAKAIFENTLTVAASDSNDGKPSWSNYGRNTVSLAAPGHEIMSTLPNNKYGNLSGTSMATPLVAGLAALLKARDPSLTGEQIRSIMQLSGAKVQIETMCNCRIDAAAAMQMVVDKPMYLTPAAWALKVGESVKMEAVNASGAIQYTSSNPAIAEVDTNGSVTAKAEGEFVITAIDANGTKAESLPLSVWKGKGGDDGGGGVGECPIPSPEMCDMLCQFQPDLPWCK